MKITLQTLFLSMTAALAASCVGELPEDPGAGGDPGEPGPGAVPVAPDEDGWDGRDQHVPELEMGEGEGIVESAPEDDGAAEEELAPPDGARSHFARLIGAGDISSCDSSGDSKTATLLDDMYGTVFAAGDTVYEDGSTSQYRDCYEPTWGRHKSRTKPSVGNHEYKTSGASGYFDYYGTAAGARGKGWYSYRRGEWLVISLNSNCGRVGCGPGSEQEEWLRATLEANPTKCAIAYMHHPRYSSGSHGNQTMVTPLWEALYDYGVDVVVAGHDHDYERFAMQDPYGNRDDEAGIREFVVGTGGKSRYSFGTTKANSLKRQNSAYGVLRLSLYPDKYYFKFVPEEGKSFTDQGYRSCH
jgi:hypothetical protein